MTLAWLGAAFILGLLAGAQVVVDPLPLLVAAACVSLLLLLRGRHPHARLAILLVAVFLLGAGRFESTRHRIGPGDVSFYNGQTVTFTGVVDAEPDVRDTGNNYVVAVQTIMRSGKAYPAAGQVEVHTAPGQLFDQGDDVQLTGPLQTPSNSAAVPYRDILAHRGIYSLMSFPKGFVTGHESLGLIGIAEAIRHWIQSTLSRSMPEPEATLLIAILIGARTAQLGNLAPVLIQTGLIHLIAVSGIKVAIVAGSVNSFLRRIAARRPALVLSIAAISGYWLVSGATVAGMRASIMWLLVFVAAFLGRPTQGLVSLALAAAIMTGIDPSLPWDTGFQLTAIATASIVAFTPLLDRATRRLPAALAAALGTTAAAQVGVLPVQIIGFHVVSSVSLLTNAVVLTFIPFTMLAGFLVCLYPHGPPLAVAYGLTHAVVVVARWAVLVPGVVRLRTLPLAFVVGYYGLLIMAAILAWRFTLSSGIRARREWLFGLVVAAAGLGFTLGSEHRPPDGLHFLVNGSTLVTDRGETILVDGGSHPSKLMTALGTTLPFGDNRIDLLIDLEPNAKNVASLLAVAQHLSVGRVLDPGVEYPSHTYARWRQWLDSQGIPTTALRAGVRISAPHLQVRVLAPDAVYPNPKDGAGVLMIRAGGRRVVILGPASPREQEDLPFRVSLSASLLVAEGPVSTTIRRASGANRVVRMQHGTFVPLP